MEEGCSVEMPSYVHLISTTPSPTPIFSKFHFHFDPDEVFRQLGFCLVEPKPHGDFPPPKGLNEADFVLVELDHPGGHFGVDSDGVHDLSRPRVADEIAPEVDTDTTY